MAKTLFNLYEFKSFCSLSCNRRNYLEKFLTVKEFPHKILKTGDAQHFILFPENLKSPGHKNILIAHYDRVKETPGANDNSAGVFILLHHAFSLKKENPDTVIIFTDKEELSESDSVKNQGSYSLAQYFKKNNYKNLTFFVFDMCGRGDTILVGTAGETMLREHMGDSYQSSSVKKRIDFVKDQAEELLLSVNSGEYFFLTPLFSDDLGLMLMGYPAVQISLLPYREAAAYKKNPQILPLSWQNNHTVKDTPESLKPGSEEIIFSLLNRISYGEKKPQTLKKAPYYSFSCFTQSTSVIPFKEITITPEQGVRLIKTPAFSVKDSAYSQKDIIHHYLILSSKVQEEIFLYFYTRLKETLPPKSSLHDYTYALYISINTFVEETYEFLPVKIKAELAYRAGTKERRGITDHLYSNTLNNIQRWPSEVKTVAVSSKNRVIIKETAKPKIFTDHLAKGKRSYYTVYIDDEAASWIECYSLMDTLIADKIIADPLKLYTLDSYNFLKGLRRALIKFAHINNNKSLVINMKKEAWVGCLNLYNLAKLELKEKKRFNTHCVFLWKRYYGVKSQIKSGTEISC